ncbi:MAG: signal peptidase II [Chloroflexi bacterium]|nr:signal peptidase II [Chloroflexota bacterium]
MIDPLELNPYSAPRRPARLVYSVVAIIIIVFLIDRFSKNWALATLRSTGGFALIPGWLSITEYQNTGIAFSLLAGQGIGPVLLSSVILLFLLCFLLFRPPRQTLLRLGLSLAAGGGLGNLFDRVVFGSVLDFVRTPIQFFGVLNFADIGISIGMVLVVLALVLRRP